MIDVSALGRNPDGPLSSPFCHGGSCSSNCTEHGPSSAALQPLDELIELRAAEARAARIRATSRPITTLRRSQKIRRNILMACVLLGFFFSLLDTTIISTSLLATSDDLNGFQDSSWVVLSYLLAYMGFSITFAKLSDIFGRRNILVMSWIVFVISSVACGCSYDMTQLIVFRAFQGVGGAGLYSLTTIALPEIGPGHRPEIIGKLIGITLSVSFVLGPVLGGFIPQISTWRVIYWLNAPFAVVAIVGIVALYPAESGRQRQRASGRRTQTCLRRVDFVGCFLLLVSSVLLVVALQEGGSLGVAWNSLVVVVSLTTAAVSFVLFIGWQCWLLSVSSRDTEPIFPFRLLHNRVYLCCLLDKFLIGYVYLSLVITVPQRFQIVNGESVLKTGIHLLPMLGGTAVGCLVAGPLNARKNRTSPAVVVSCGLMLVGNSLLARANGVDSPAGPLYGFLAVFGLGFGLFMSAGTMLSTAQAQPGDHAVAQGAIAQLRILGGVIGLACFTIVFNAHVRSAGLEQAMTARQLDVLRRSPSALIEIWPELQSLIQAAYTSAFHAMATILAGISGLALLISLGTLEKNPPSIHHSLVADNKEFSPSRSDPETGAPDDAASDRSLVDFHVPVIAEPMPTLFLPPRSRSRMSNSATQRFMNHQ